MIRRTLVILCLLVTASGCALLHRGAGASGQGASANRVAVYVFTEPRTSPIPVRDQLSRERYAATLRRFLERNKNLAVVDTASQANVRVRVQSAASVFNPEMNGANFDPNEVPVDLTAAGRTIRMTESSNTEYRTLRKLANRIEAWIQENRAALAGKRPAR